MRIVRMLIVLLVGLSFATPALADEAGMLASREGITRELAERDITAQQSNPTIVEDLEAHLGTRYGGVWFNNKTGYFMVDRPPGVTVAAAKEAVNGAPARFPEVKYTMSELLSRQQELDRSLSTYEQAQQAGSYVYPKSNVVKLLYASNLSLPQKEEIKAIAARTGSQTTSTKYSALAPSKTSWCEFPFCYEGEKFHEWGTVRGGVRITFGEHAYCTAGFVVTVEGSPKLLTAGHCDEDLTTWTNQWYQTGFSGEQPCHMNVAAWHHNSAQGDEGLATLGGCESHKSVEAWGTNVFEDNRISEELSVETQYKTYGISCVAGVECWRLAQHGAEQSYPGLWVCHIGATTVKECGTINANHVTLTVGPEKVTLHRLEWICTRVAGGDSGGPVIARSKEGQARGTSIVVAGYYENSCGTYGQELLGETGALEELNASL